MTERPIIFSGPMVRAILREADPKTQTRRLVTGMALTWLDQFLPEFVADQANHLSPYGHAGDRLWVRETFCMAERIMSLVPTPCYRATEGDINPGLKWRPSIHMPRTACRLKLDVVAVRIERLHDISEQDCIAEGIKPAAIEPAAIHYADGVRGGYAWLWDSLNAKRGHGWSTNPWVWVIEFRRVDG